MSTRADLITNFIFARIPKTGGTSVSSVLGCRDVFHHNTAAKIRMDIGQELWDSCFKFTFIRNPWDHAVSYYEATKNQLRLAPQMIVSGSFGGWVLDGMKTFPMTRWIVPGQKQDPLLQEQYIEDDIFVGRFENLQEDFDYVCDQIGRPSVELPHLNPSKRQRDYRSYYQNPEVKRLVGEHGSGIIEKYEYQF